MKLLDIMKKYDRCLVRESAKLTKIYNMILKESELDSDINEDTCPECGNDPCTCDETETVDANDLFEDDDSNMIPEEEFMCVDSEEVEENDMLRNRPHNAHVDDPAGVVSENDNECNEDAASTNSNDMISAEDFFAEVDEADNEIKDVDEADEMMSAEEFFNSNSSPKDVKENEKDELDEFEDVMISAKSLLENDDKQVEEDEKNEEKQLQESLKSYRRKNHHLFNG